METRKCTRLSAERRRWGEIFNHMVRWLQMQQIQLKTFGKDRKILLEYVKVLHNRWISDTHRYENAISQMQSDMLVQEQKHSFDAAKFLSVMGLNERDAKLSGLNHALTASELKDFIALFDILCEKCPTLSDHHSRNSLQTSKSMDGEERELRQAYEKLNSEQDHHSRNSLQTSKSMDGEERELRQAYEKLNSEKDSEVAFPVMENKFAWNHNNIMEEDYTRKLRSKNSEVERANLTIKKLLVNLEELQKSNQEKDDATQRNKLKEEICRLSNERDSLRTLNTVSNSPALKRCNSKHENSVLVEGKSNIMGKKDASSAEISNPRKNNQMGSKSSKRKRNEVIGVLDSPKLFSSSIKIPKLKSTCRS